MCVIRHGRPRGVVGIDAGRRRLRWLRRLGGCRVAAREPAGGSDLVGCPLPASRRLNDLRRSTRRSCVSSPRRSASSWSRRFSATGGHLGPNLGVVELTLALHRGSSPPPTRSSSTRATRPTSTRSSPVVRTSRLAAQAGRSLRLSVACRERTRLVESSHASAALSYADGLAKAFELSAQRDRQVVAVVGDGALTGGSVGGVNTSLPARTFGRDRRQRQRTARTRRRSG